MQDQAKVSAACSSALLSLREVWTSCSHRLFHFRSILCSHSSLWLKWKITPAVLLIVCVCRQGSAQEGEQQDWCCNCANLAGTEWFREVYDYRNAFRPCTNDQNIAMVPRLSRTDFITGLFRSMIKKLPWKIFVSKINQPAVSFAVGVQHRRSRPRLTTERDGCNSDQSVVRAYKPW